MWATHRKEVHIHKLYSETVVELTFVRRFWRSWRDEDIAHILAILQAAIPCTALGCDPRNNKRWQIDIEYWPATEKLLNACGWSIVLVSSVDVRPSCVDVEPSGKNGLRNTCRNSLNHIQQKVKRLKVEAPKSLRIPLIISLGFLIFAVSGNWSYDFFVLLRVVIFTTCIISLVAIWKANRSSNWLGVLVAIGVIYNPLLALHLHRPTWNWLNWVAIIVLGLLCNLLKPEQPESDSHNGPTIHP